MLEAAALAFNLVCHANELTGNINWGFGKNPAKQIDIVYRVDLNRNRWCQDDCLKSFPIAKLEDVRLMLEFEADKELGTDTVTLVDRETGGFSRRTRYGLAGTEPTDKTGVILDEGTCEKAPFTGLPTSKF